MVFYNYTGSFMLNYSTMSSRQVDSIWSGPRRLAPSWPPERNTVQCEAWSPNKLHSCCKHDTRPVTLDGYLHSPLQHSMEREREMIKYRPSSGPCCLPFHLEGFAGVRIRFERVYWNKGTRLPFKTHDITVL